MRRPCFTTWMVAASVIALCAGTSIAEMTGFGMTWTRPVSGPVLSTGGPSPYESDHVFQPSVLIDGGIYRMWYAGHNGGAVGICYATSTDEGRTWTKHGTVLEHTEGWETAAAGYTSLSSPSVIKDGNTYRMWYSCAGGNVVGYATSADGIHWSKSLQLPASPTGYSAPNVMEGPTGYLLYYAHHNNSPAGLYAMESSDGGVTDPWSPVNGGNSVLPSIDGTWAIETDLGPRYPEVRYDSILGKYQMWFMGAPSHNNDWRIGYAESADGWNWTQDPSNPALEAMPGTWEWPCLQTGSVVYDMSDSTYRMFYEGWSGHIQIGLAEAQMVPVPGAALLGALGLGISSLLCRRRRET